MSERKIEISDEAPKLSYKGRHFDIRSDGTVLGTRIWIDGAEQKLVSKLLLKIEPRWTRSSAAGVTSGGDDLVRVELTMLDVEVKRE